MEPIEASFAHNVVAIRAEPRAGSELVSQGVAGEWLTMCAVDGDYALVRTRDGYEGWALQAHLLTKVGTGWLMDEEALFPRVCRIAVMWAEVRAEPKHNSRLLTKLTLGAQVLQSERADDGSEWVRVERTAEDGWLLADCLCPLDAFPPFSQDAVCDLACQFIGTPYLWGGTTSFGFDCSGFLQRVYRQFGIILPRDAYLQAQSPLGAAVAEGEPLQAGDLVFFCGLKDPRGRGITHVGMALNAHEIIHAYGRDGVIVSPFADFAGPLNYTCKGAWRHHPPQEVRS